MKQKSEGPWRLGDHQRPGFSTTIRPPQYIPPATKSATTSTCGHAARRHASHVLAPGADALALCRSCWRAALAGDARAIHRRQFEALFRLCPPAFGLGGALGSLAMLLARIGKEGRVAA